MIDLETAERLASESAVAVPTRRDLLIATGADAASYLHGQLSQDVEGLAVGDSAWTLLLQPQGKIDAWMRIHRRSDDAFWLDVEAGFGEAARARLERFKLRVDAEFELVTVDVVAVRGPQARTAAEAALTGGAPAVAVDASWGDIPGVDLLPDHPGGGTDPEALVPPGVAIGPPEALELIRVLQGRPAMGSELDDGTIPAAAGIVDHSVDFTKGCYVGQELVARVDSRGSNTPTRLFGLRIDGDGSAEAGAGLSVDGSPAGTVTSVARSPRSGTVALGYLKRGVEPTAALEVALPDGGTAPVAVVALAAPQTEGPGSPS